MRIFVTILFLAQLAVHAATYCLGPTATGTASGADWNNQKAWSTDLARGDTGYLRGGTYGNRTLNVANSGTTRIIYKKATASDHVTETGWSAAYGTDVAVLGTLSIFSGYWTINGQAVTSENTTTAVYGIKCDFTEGQVGIDVFGSGCSDIIIQYVDMDGISTTGNHNYTGQCKGLVIERTVTNLLVSHCAFHGLETCIQEGDGNTSNGFDSDGTIVEYCFFWNSRSTAASFHNNIYYCSGSQNGTFRFNRVNDYNDEGFFPTGWEGSPKAWKVYGNLFWANGGEQNPRACEIRQDYSYTNLLFWNNTMVGLGNGGIINRAPETGGVCSGCGATNNISVNSPNTLTGMSASNNTDDSTTSRFSDYAGKDFSLAAPLAGVALDATYNTDIIGVTRGADGVWDQGAYEFAIANTAPTITGPANQSIVQNTATSALAVTIGDAETAAASLSLGAVSSDQTIVSNANCVLGGSGANRTITCTGDASHTGTCTITLTVTDGGGLTAQATFTVTVYAIAGPAVSVGSNYSKRIAAFHR